MMKLSIVTENGLIKEEVEDLKAASRKYRKHRDESGLGASGFCPGVVIENGKKIARISYNGRVWGPKPWKAGDKPLLEAQG